MSEFSSDGEHLPDTFGPGGDCGVDAEVVRAIYRSILGREPESNAIVDLHLGRGKRLEQLLMDFLSCDEFANRRATLESGVPTCEALHQVLVPLLQQLQTFRDRTLAAEKAQRVLFAPDFVASHKLQAARPLRTRLGNPTPNVLLAILAKQKQKSLPLYLECIDRLNYPKASISIYIRTNNNTDDTEKLLRDWVDRNGNLYRNVEFDATDVSEPVQVYRVHEWNATRFRVLGDIRNASLKRAIEHQCAYYFVCDVDNFIAPWTLTELVALGLPITAPLLRNFSDRSFNSNFFQEVDENGYYREENSRYFPILTRSIRGVIETKLVHHTYLVRGDVIPELTYSDGSGRYEFVVFADSARRAGIPQYVDNRQIYGYITSGDEFGYRPGDEEDAVINGAAAGPGQVALTRRVFEDLWFHDSVREQSILKETL